MKIAFVLIVLSTIGIFYSVFAYTLTEKNAILDEFGKIDKPIESTFDKCRINFDVVKNNDTKLANACMDFVSRYTKIRSTFIISKIIIEPSFSRSLTLIPFELRTSLTLSVVS